MARHELRQEDAILEKQIIETMMAGWEYPKSYSDWQGSVRALMKMFEIKRRPLAVELKAAGEDEQ